MREVLSSAKDASDLDLSASGPTYFMESEAEALRLDLKTVTAAVEEQARWAGVGAGMRVLDLGCGAGKTTHILHGLVRPGGEVVGLDSSQQRIDYAREHYAASGIAFVRGDARRGLGELGRFDLAWVRFLLEYYEQLSSAIVKNAFEVLTPGGTLCLIDLDQNCLGHFGASQRLEKTMRKMVLAMQKQYGFDPFAGRKLYAYLYDAGCVNIEVRMVAHHLIHGQLSETDRFNWLSKVEAARHAPDLLAEDYPGGYREFCDEFLAYLEHPRRFLYTPLIQCTGQKPLAAR